MGVLEEDSHANTSCHQIAFIARGAASGRGAGLCRRRGGGGVETQAEVVAEVRVEVAEVEGKWRKQRR